MQLQSIREQDIVLCDVKGRRFRADVVAKERGKLEIDPPNGITYRSVKANQVVGHWRHVKGDMR